MGRIRNITVRLLSGSRRRIERKLLIFTQVKLTLGYTRARRPRIEGSPAVGAGLKGQRFRLIELALVLQVVGKPGMQNIGAEVLTGRAAKIDVAQFIAGGTIPAAMVPGTGHQMVHVVRVGLLQNLIRFDGSVEIFLIPPARDVHDGYGDLLELIDQRLLLPKLVVVRVGDEVIPGRYFAVKVFRVGVRKRSEPQVPLISIVSIKFEVRSQV